MDWIPCSERVPAVTDEYLITWTIVFNGKIERGISIAEYYAEAEEWNIDDYIKSYGSEVIIIAWMPCPEAYKGEEE